MRIAWTIFLLAAAGPDSAAAEKTFKFSGRDWVVRANGKGGPGPNLWDAANAWVDAEDRLHLKLNYREGKWRCAEVRTKERLGFGRYQFQVEGRIDRLDRNVVFGLFNFPTRDVGPNATHEIDVEFARWGIAEGHIGSFTVWPTKPSLKQASKTFPVTLTGDRTTHRFNWTPTSVRFQSLHGYRDDDDEQFAEWRFQPKEASDRIAQKAMPIHVNLWCFKGRPPTDARPVELIVRSFKFTPSAGTK